MATGATKHSRELHVQSVQQDFSNIFPRSAQESNGLKQIDIGELQCSDSTAVHVQIMDRITGKQLPWEEDKNRSYFRQKLGIFKNTLLELLDSDSAGRPTMRQFSAACSSILGGSSSVEQN